MAEPHVVILGAGPAGLGAAYRLRQAGRARVTVLEQSKAVGGNSGSFEAGGQYLDYGSHRLHPACDPAILADIRRLLDGDLLDRPRHGRILLRGKLIHFPLKPLDLLARLDKGFALETMRDMAAKMITKRDEGDTFASVLMANLGPTICRDFYFPYANKIWGRSPDELSATQARRRISAGSFGKLVKKVVTAIPAFRPPGAGRFFYPRKGFGQISEAYANAARAGGADLRLRWSVKTLEARSSATGNGDSQQGWILGIERDGERGTLEADYVWSTVPISLLARMMVPAAPSAVLRAATEIEYRAMLLIYLQLDVDRFTEYDAHYFPSTEIGITRLSEPKNYAASSEPIGSTTLCAELPCTPGDQYWQMSDEELGRLVAADLSHAGIPLRRPPVAVYVRRLHHAYPIYTRGYEQPFHTLDEWAAGLPHLLTYGRQGLFAHDNTHHALSMAYRAVDCLRDGRFDNARWAEHRKVFEKHVVED